MVVRREEFQNSEPLFIALERANYGQRLSGTSVYRIVRQYGKDAGVSEVFSPHSVRHSGVTAYLEMTDEDLQGGQSYSRYVNFTTLKFYDDTRQQFQKKASEKLSGAIADTI